MSVWKRIASRVTNGVGIAWILGGVGIALVLGLVVLVLVSAPGPKAPQLLTLPGWPAGLPNGYVMALAMLMLLTGHTANDGFAIVEGMWLAALIARLPVWLGWLLAPSYVSPALPFIHTAMGCWIVFFMWRHGGRFVYAAVSILTLPFCLVPGIGPAINRWHSKAFGLRRASEQPPRDSE